MGDRRRRRPGGRPEHNVSGGRGAEAAVFSLGAVTAERSASHPERAVVCRAARAGSEGEWDQSLSNPMISLNDRRPSETGNRPTR